ncbi:uncharacterized protein LOC131845399 [Achroia grisella]|uniref:uncharacterized protein LOC131845399 n=1 Tax=Achroia grisella TaxID=688607 RepID=UPI0027D224C1|nr:uncharacterized protein LOC131845399 [Achroia grisella]XP_059050442.1 uncharacterized protein LOC131845399 [Achroia grisella]XP_059050443.1 uncharacterized protein LOC131845399 [Achroia grisella]XP_059050444.1 uncharacterized protein LOC131845399 [Achroia grisella]
MVMSHHSIALAALVIIAIIAPHFTAHPPSADKAIDKDRLYRQTAVKSGKNVANTPKWGFFGTIFHLILEQINDTKSAYNQISDLVNNQFTDDNTITVSPDTVNGTTQAPKISRSEFLNILERNLKGLVRLRNLEWREARKDTMTNLRQYKDEIFRGKTNTKEKKREN